MLKEGRIQETSVIIWMIAVFLLFLQDN